MGAGHRLARRLFGLPAETTEIENHAVNSADGIWTPESTEVSKDNDEERVQLKRVAEEARMAASQREGVA